MTRLTKHPDLSQNIVKAQAGKHRFPPFIKSVPTVQIPDPRAPGKAIIYEGDDAFSWLDDQTAASLDAGPGGAGGLMDYDPMAMGGVFGGGAFAFAGADDKDAGVENLTMANYNDPNSGMIGVQEQSGMSGGSAKEDEMNRRFEMMQMQRDKDMASVMGNQGPRGQGPPPSM